MFSMVVLEDLVNLDNEEERVLNRYARLLKAKAYDKALEFYLDNKRDLDSAMFRLVLVYKVAIKTDTIEAEQLLLELNKKYGSATLDIFYGHVAKYPGNERQVKKFISDDN